MTSQLTTEASPDSRIPRRWLTAVRVIWLTLVLSLIPLPIASAPAYFNELRMPCAADDCYVLALTSPEVDMLQDLGLSLEFYAGYQVGLQVFASALFIVLAGFIFWRKSDSWMGILVSLTLAFIGVGNEFYTELYPNLRLLLAISDTIFSVLLVLLFYTFPDGRFVPRWTRTTIIIVAGAALFYNFLPSLGSFGSPVTLGEGAVIILFFGGLIVGVFAQVYRYRKVSTPTQRQQTKWTVFGLVVTFITLILWTTLADLFPLQPGVTRLAYNLSTGILAITFMFLPISVAISILRYRLWDIDIIINRALVYGLLTAALGLIYFASVVLLQFILNAVGGQQTAVVTVISTLAIAALFNPLRHRIQESIDRRFYRRKYDAEQVLAAFAETVRDEVNLDRLAGTLLTVAEDAMQPEHVSLWFEEQERRSPRWNDS
jgi:MFS family permease